MTAPGGRDRDPAPRDVRPTGRDRDPAGRPRSARPRDGLGRPLPKGAVGGEPRVPDDLLLPPEESLALADRLLAEGRPFHAHEVLEASWKAAPPDERDFWQGLAQLAVGLTHARRGNAAGAVTLLRRGAARIRGYAPASPHGVPVARVAADAEDLARQLGRDSRTEAPASSVNLRLRA
jgi:hypothetical protein